MTATRIALALLSSALPPQIFAQPYDAPDHGQPGDQMIQDYLRLETAKIEADFLGAIKSAEDWTQARPRFREEYFDMLGLWPLPEKTRLQATITRTLERGDYTVEMLHYQSRPGLYVTANLYRPAKTASGQRLPAILYVCGHSGRGRNGNKTAFQSHGIWFARHGYVCLVVDTLQLGEIAGIHHGTYREGRWWWLSRGYTPAGVECWNGVRGIDHLLSRPDVDAERIGVTGISGGGAATFWIAAADERVKVAVPVSGMADLVSYVPNRVINGHCDCMFLYDTYQWPWTRIAALVAPRPMLFVNSDQDAIFPMDANERVINRLERLYSLFGASDVVDSVVSIGGHAYRQDIRQATFRFLNTHLKNDPRPVLDSEVDLVTGPREEVHPIPPEQLRVFPRDEDIPRDALNARIDQEFVPLAKVELPKEGQFDAWRSALLTRLRRMTFHHFPERIPAAVSRWALHPATVFLGSRELLTETNVVIRWHSAQLPPGPAKRVLLWITKSDVAEPLPTWLADLVTDGDEIQVCEPRGVGGKSWTRKNPPNYIERAHYLLGRTVDSGRVWDIAATARYLRALHKEQVPVHVVGEGAAAVLAAYAALLEPDIAGLILRKPPASHMDDSAPALLNVLRVCDIPEAVGMLAPRPLTLVEVPEGSFEKTAAIYRAAGAAEKLVVSR
ncbi:MAG: prolyl oligopeptidase family serine peptidase [Verrucomicrobia bacterium]|nr:prolyl oligopeptidase family serine peptidase [Verrucomicrobiota bacterium]